MNSFTGTSGADSFVGFDSSDVFNLFGGNDTAHGIGGGDSLYGGNGNDFLFGGDGQDRLWGGADEDFLYGGGSSDTLFGGNALDVLDGGNGSDTLTGGSDEADAFVSQSGSAGIWHDVITDFAGDRLYLGAGDAFVDLDSNGDGKWTAADADIVSNGAGGIIIEFTADRTLELLGVGQVFQISVVDG